MSKSILMKGGDYVNEFFSNQEYELEQSLKQTLAKCPDAITAIWFAVEAYRRRRKECQSMLNRYLAKYGTEGKPGEALSKYLKVREVDQPKIEELNTRIKKLGEVIRLLEQHLDDYMPEKRQAIEEIIVAHRHEIKRLEEERDTIGRNLREFQFDAAQESSFDELKKLTKLLDEQNEAYKHLDDRIMEYKILRSNVERYAILFRDEFINPILPPIKL